MANLDRSKKALVRVALVSGSTIATLVGAQTVAMLDQNVQIAQQPATPVAPTILPTLPPTPTAEIIHEAPSITILRPHQTTNAPRPRVNQPSANPVILPPNPQQVSAPAPVVVQQQQQQAPAVSRSSR